jgi:hypothetical protein
MSDSQDDIYSDDPVDAPTVPAKRKLSAILASLTLLIGGAYFVQTTLASNIFINSGQIEFGQGATATTACTGSNTLTVTPSAAFVNASGSGSHYFSSFTVSNIPNTCYGADFTIKAYGNSGNFSSSYYYYSSSQTGSNPFSAYIQGFSNGAATTNQWSDAGMRVRPIRAF